jgi:D-glycero-D-manno-heptose 1,7-bisphosphate phosphatase
MLQRAAAALDIELSASWMIGDRWRDVDCAHAAGCRAVFIDHGYGEPLRDKPEFTVTSFCEAVAAILQNQLPQSATQD